MSPENKLDQSVDTSFIQLAEGTLGQEAPEPTQQELDKKFTVGKPTHTPSPVNTADKKRANELLQQVESARIPNQQQEQRPQTQEATTSTKKPEDIKKTDSILSRYLGLNVAGLSYEQIAEGVKVREWKNKDFLKKIKGISLSVGGLTGLVGGLFAPGIIGTTPSLAAALPAFMSSTVSIGSLSIASSAIAMGGLGIGIGAIGLGAYQLKKFLDARKSKKVQEALENRKIDKKLKDQLERLF
jgi:hypothetical protein